MIRLFNKIRMEYYRQERANLMKQKRDAAQFGRIPFFIFTKLNER